MLPEASTRKGTHHTMNLSRREQSTLALLTLVACIATWLVDPAFSPYLGVPSPSAITAGVTSLFHRVESPPPSHASAAAVVDSASSTVTGAATISAVFIDHVLWAYGSPAAGTGQALYDLGAQSGIDPVYALAFFLHEDSFGKTGIGAANQSLGNIRCSAGYSCQYGFRSYATWQDGYRDWYSLILNGYVKGEITNSIVGHPCTTVDEIVPVYAPSSDHNDVVAYIAAVKHSVQTWRKGRVWV